MISWHPQFSVRPVPIALSRYTDAERAAVHALLSHSSLAPEFDWLVDRGELKDPLRHPWGDPEALWVGRLDGELAGFCMLMRLVGQHGRWAFLRIGVAAPFRRRGLGRAFVRAVEARIDALPAGERPLEVCTSAWLPNPAAEGFAAGSGFAHSRYFWSMERPRGAPASVSWPAGIETCTFDGSEQALADWTACYNDSFGENYLTAIATVEHTRELTRLSHFRADGVVLAYHDGRCVGFCRNAVHQDHGEIDVLGVVHEARGIGLGRSLLRWGVAWLEERDVPHVRLMVGGENEAALRLYRSEGFETVRTRRIWARAVRA